MMDTQSCGGNSGVHSLRRIAVDQVCLCLASADQAVVAALFSRLAPGTASASASANAASVSNPLGSPPSPRAGGGGGGVGVPSSIGDAILERAREMGCSTTNGVLELLRWCTPRVLCLDGASPTVTDALLLKYPAESCGVLEDVRLGWAPHLLEVEALLLKIRKAGVGGQGDEACALRHLDVSGNEELSDGILKGLSGRCPSLSTLRVDSCPRVTGAFLERLGAGCPSLSTLSADGCAGVTDSAVSNFVMESRAMASGALQSLHLGGCPIGAMTAQALVMRGACLRDVNLDGCLGLGDAAVRMVCRACPGLVELSLLGCAAVTCRGAWQCTQHPSVETLSISLLLLPGPEPIPVEKIRARGRGRGASRRCREGIRSGVSKVEDGEEEAAAAGSGVGTGAPRRGADAPRKGVGRWACDRCTCLNTERRSTCEACRAPCLGNTLPPSHTHSCSPPRSAGLSPRSSVSPSSSSMSPGGNTRRRGAKRASSPMESPPLPLPAVPHETLLRRLRLEIAPATAEAVAAEAMATAAVAVATSDDAVPRNPMPGSDAAFSFPLRRLAPLLPPRLAALEVWSCNAPPPPPPPQISGTVGTVQGPAVRQDRSVGVRCARRRRNGGADNEWRVAGAGGGEETPAFDRTGSRGGGREGHRATGRSGGEGGDVQVRPGVEIAATPGELVSIGQACPTLRELVICGDSNPRVARAPVGPRIRGRGADARKTTASAGIHAAAAALAYFFRCCAEDSHPSARRADTVAAAAADSGDPRISALRELTLIDCPFLPPFAVLEALGVEGGAGLGHVTVGFSSAPPTKIAAQPAGRSSARGRPRTPESLGQGGRLDGGVCAGVAMEGTAGVAVPGGGGRKGDCPGVGANTEAFGGEGTVSVSSESIQSLYVAGDDNLVGLRLDCPRLERLDLLRCPLLRSLEVRAMPKLSEARVEGCCLGDSQVASLAKAGWRLETLSFAGNDSVGDPAILTALAECPDVRSLRLHSCRAVGGSSTLVPFLRKWGSSLSHGMPPAPATTVAALTVASTPWLRLEELTVSHAPGFTGAHLAALADGVPFLRRLSVSHCRSLVDLSRLTDADGGGADACGSPTVMLMESVREADLADEVSRDEKRPDGDGGGGSDVGGSGFADRWENDGIDGHDDEIVEQEEKGRGVEDGAVYGEEECAGEVGDTLTDATLTIEREDEATPTFADPGDDVDTSGTQREAAIATHERHHCSSSTGARGGGRKSKAQRRKDAKGGTAGGGAEKVTAKDAGRRRRKGSTDKNLDDIPAAITTSSDHNDHATAEDEESRGSLARSGRGKRRNADGKNSRGGRAASGNEPLREEDFATKEAGASKIKGRVGGAAAGATVEVAAAPARKSGRGKKHAGDDIGGDEDGDACQGLEFRVDGKTRAKLERLAEALPREPGKKRRGRPSCIRFLQEACPRSAADCPWAHLPMHPPKTLKFKPLITHAQEPSPKSMNGPVPLQAGAKSAASSVRRPGGALDAARGSGNSASSAFGRSATASAPAADSEVGGSDIRRSTSAVTADFDEVSSDVVFGSLQFLEIQACTGLKRLEGLRCPALAAARVTACRQLTSLSLEAPALSHLDLSACVRLESWELIANGSLAGLQVAVLNYCRALSPKALALLVNHARHLRKLEIYGAAVVETHGHGPGGSSMGKIDRSRADYIRAKTAAILKGLEKGRPKLTVVRTKKAFMREQEGPP